MNRNIQLYYIQLKDSYNSKKGDLWKSLTQPYTDISDKIYENTRTIERLEEYQLQDKEWFAPYEEKKYARSWEELDKIGGYFISNDSKIHEYGVIDFSMETNGNNRNIYATKNQAKSALAEAQLSQLLKQIYDSESWKPVWGGTRTNYCITLFDGVAKISTLSSNAMFLAFPTLKLAYQFLENHRELIEIYFSKYNWQYENI